MGCHDEKLGFKFQNYVSDNFDLTWFNHQEYGVPENVASMGC